MLGYLGCDMNHQNQLHLAEFCAWHLAQVLTNVDMLAIARTTQIVQKDGSPIEDESVEAERESKFPASGKTSTTLSWKRLLQKME